MSTRDLQLAQALHKEGRFADAESAYRKLLEHAGDTRAAALLGLSDVYLRLRRPFDAVRALSSLVADEPEELSYRDRLAALLTGLRQVEDAIRQYEAFLHLRPDAANAWFNVALLYKSENLYERAIQAYEQALRLNIENAQEVYTNMGVVYSEARDAGNAEKMYLRAIALQADYVPALFNLAGLYEELGNRERAIEKYEEILRIKPDHDEALARIVYATPISKQDDPLLEKIRFGIDAADSDSIERETLLFALGKALDDIGDFDAAFAAYRQANTIGALRNKPYDRNATERAFDQLIALFDRDWLEKNESDSEATPVFICGLFRSGSTLTEQLLASHPSIQSGGELGFLPWLISRKLSPYPNAAKSVDKTMIYDIGRQYLALVQERFPGGLLVTDKRPDNFLHLALARAMFPKARFVFTKRNPLDNCISIYFQQMGGALNYATSLEDTAHYYLQHLRLMAHWETFMGDSIETVDYDELVRDPVPIAQRLCQFVGIEWDDKMLEFQRAENMVKTASIWQVRDRLSTKSSERWRNYEHYVQGIKNALLRDQ